MHLHCAMWCRIFITLVIACCCYQEEVAVRSHRSTADFCTLVQDLSSNTFRVYWHICRAFLYLINHLSVCCDVSKRGFVSRSLHYWWTLSGRPIYHSSSFPFDQLFPLSLTDDQRVRILKYTFPPFALSSSSSFPPSSSSSHHHLCDHDHHLARPHAGDSSCDRRCEEQDWVKRAFELT